MCPPPTAPHEEWIRYEFKSRTRALAATKAVHKEFAYDNRVVTDYADDFKTLLVKIPDDKRIRERLVRTLGPVTPTAGP
jgi:hypothetical protein